MRLKVRTYEDGDRTVVEVSGELDLQAEQELKDALQQALGASAGGLALDLRGVDYLGRPGLNVLLTIRQRALDQHKRATLRAVSPAVARLLVLTDTFALLTEGDEDLEQDPRVEVAQLRRALQTRPTIDMARGILMATFGMNAEDAWAALVEVSQNTNTKLHRFADHVVTAVEGDPLPELLQGQLAAVAARITAIEPRPTDEETWGGHS